jgi:hypothetical protein
LTIMTATRFVQALALVAAALSTAACGQSATSRAPILADVPLVAGTHVAAQVRSCDRGADPYCAMQLVVVGSRYGSSTALLAGEQRRLGQLGWTSGVGDTGDERSADSPGHKLRLTYATASNDLMGIDFGWIERRRPIALALSTEMFDRAPVISLMLETGSL